jgi:hypothetical protein
MAGIGYWAIIYSREKSISLLIVKYRSNSQFEQQSQKMEQEDILGMFLPAL